jgi:uncharacterized membrane protein YcaP (DUF421 family)
METVLRAAILWLFIWLMLRVMGRKELSQLSPFEFVLLVVMGDLIQQGVTEQDTSVTAAVLAVSTMVLLTLALSYVGYRWSAVAPIVEGTPVIVIHGGNVLRKVLDTERVSQEELRDAAREQGIDDLRKVRLGVMENDGSFSFLVDGGPVPPQQRTRKERPE